MCITKPALMGVNELECYKVVGKTADVYNTVFCTAADGYFRLNETYNADRFVRMDVGRVQEREWTVQEYKYNVGFHAFKNLLDALTLIEDFQLGRHYWDFRRHLPEFVVIKVKLSGVIYEETYEYSKMKGVVSGDNIQILEEVVL